jgi:hypothetical protein
MEKPKNFLTEEELQEKVEIAFAEALKMPEVAEALEILDGLPENLKYHDKGHTLDVIKETILFALADNAGEEITKQQVIAAAWHDIGYIKQYEQNEPVAVDLFRQSKAFQNLSEEERDEIVADIMDTQLIMRDGEPYLLQERSKFGYLLDGDVSNFGREDYFEKRMKVAEELRIDLSNPEIKKKFFAFALALLKNHEWKTGSARFLRQAQKEKNLEQLGEEYQNLFNSPVA